LYITVSVTVISLQQLLAVGKLRNVLKQFKPMTEAETEALTHENKTEALQILAVARHRDTLRPRPSHILASYSCIEVIIKTTNLLQFNNFK